MIFQSNKLLSAVALASILLLTWATALNSCTSRTDGDSDIVARVKNSVLKKEDVERALPLGLPEADSLALASDYIDRWIVNELIGEIASKNIHNLEEIDKMTADYRRSLIMDEYRRLKIEQDTSLMVKKADIEEFYANYGGEMRLDKPMIRGIFIAVAKSSPQLQTIRRCYASNKADDIEKLEKIGLTEAVTYEYFRNNWMPLASITDRIPAKPNVTHKGQKIELSDESKAYFLSISDFLPAGASMPLSAAEPEIKNMLENARKQELDSRLKSQLYNQAIKNGNAWRMPEKETQQ